MARQSSHPSDAVRYSHKLWQYVLAVEVISKAMKAIETRGGTDELDFERRILAEILLPPLSQAFNSEVAFYADMAGKICSTVPADSPLVGKTLPPSKYVENLSKRGEPLVIVESKDIPSELNVLGVQSLLVVRLVVPWGGYLVGICNGQNDPAYAGEDKKFLNTLMEIIGSSFGYGHIQAETHLAYERYVDAQRSGRYNFLSRASEDYARLKLHLQSDASSEPIEEEVMKDDLLADYLDAELCRVMQDSTPSAAKDEPPLEKDKTNAESSEGVEIPDSLKHLLSLVKLSESRESFIIRLRDNQAWTGELKPQERLRTTLAVARISLWAGYIKAGVRAPEWINERELEQRRESLPEDWYKVSEAVDLFYTIPDWLLKASQVEKKVEEDPSCNLLHIDWLRTLWQQIHYLARSGVSEPRQEWIEEIGEIYKKVRLLSGEKLQAFVEAAYQPKEGLHVDSDWLTVWMVSNVLLSKRLAEHYGMGKLQDSKPVKKWLDFLRIPQIVENLSLKNSSKEAASNPELMVASPTEKMRYFTHLSHLVLYALHCTRYLDREKEVQKRKPDAIVERSPFAEVPIDLSLGLSEAQLYILSEYAYREIGIHRELVLFERLARQLRYELPLYAASEFYRDHLFHVVDVCLLGELLLRSRIASRYLGVPQNLLDAFRNGTGCKDSRLLMQNWYIAALCHDLGYVVERVGNLLEPVHTINGPGLDEFWKAVKDGLEYGDTKIKKTTKSKLSSLSNLSVTKDDLEKVAATDHGVAAWLHLHHWLDQVKESPQKLTPALNAILRHNLPEPQVSCRREPLTLLLMLCDHLQEWGRPRVGPDLMARGVMEALRFSKQAEFERKVRVKRLVIKGLKLALTKNNSIQTQIEPSGLEFKLSHVESREGDFEPAISWLLLCRDLQCFGNQGKELPFDIRIILEHTPSRIWHMMPWKPLEMDLVQEFASGHEQVAYLCDWVEKARLSEDDKGIHYEGDRITGVETFSIHLNKLGRPLPRGLPNEHWKKFFQWKWRRLGQQFIDVSLGDWFPEL